MFTEAASADGLVPHLVLFSACDNEGEIYADDLTACDLRCCCLPKSSELLRLLQFRCSQSCSSLTALSRASDFRSFLHRSMCGPKFCSMQISTELQAYAKEHGLGEEQEARSAGMEEMSSKFRQQGAEVYMVRS